MTGIGKYQRYRNPEMPLTDSEIRALKAGEKMKDFSAGPGLRIRLEPAKKGGGKSFYGYMYFPPGGGGKKVWVCIGPYGKVQASGPSKTPGTSGSVSAPGPKRRARTPEN